MFPEPCGRSDIIPTENLYWEDVWKQITRLRPKLYRIPSGKTGKENCAAVTSESETFVKANISSERLLVFPCSILQSYPKVYRGRRIKDTIDYRLDLWQESQFDTRTIVSSL